MIQRSERITPTSLTTHDVWSIAVCHLDRGTPVYRCHSRTLDDGQATRALVFRVR